MSRFKIDEHKLYYHLDRVAKWQYNDPRKVYPIYVEISPTSVCNHRCTFCALDYVGYANNKIDTQVLKRTIRNMSLHGVRSIMFAGEGEPLLHPDIGEIIDVTNSSGIDVALTTNAVALTPTFCKRALKHLMWMKISCNAGDAKTYAKVHGCTTKDFYKVWKNIEYAVKLRKSFQNNQVSIGVQAVLLPENAHTMPELAHRCREAGVDYLVIKPYSQHKKSLTVKYSELMYGEAYNKYLNSLAMYASSKFELITRHVSMEAWDEKSRCYDKCLSVPYFWAYLMTTGALYGCSAFLGDERFCYGNVNKHSFNEIWLGKKRKQAITFMNHGLDIKECRQNCRMHKINTFLWNISNPGEHRNFI